MDNQTLWIWARVALQCLSSMAHTHTECTLASITYYYYYYSKMKPGVCFIMTFFYVVLTIEARTGRKRVAVATLLVHSVKVDIRRQRTMAMAQGGILCRGVN